jgi:hypothetical protein
MTTPELTHSKAAAENTARIKERMAFSRSCPNTAAFHFSIELTALLVPQQAFEARANKYSSSKRSWGERAWRSVSTKSFG